MIRWLAICLTCQMEWRRDGGTEPQQRECSECKARCQPSEPLLWFVEVPPEQVAHIHDAGRTRH
jgi:hypothetical protein